MADAIVLPQARPAQPALQFLRVIPGVLLLAAVGYAGKLLERNVGTYAKAHHWTFPNIEYVLWGHSHRPGDFQYRRRAPDFSGRSGDLRILAEGRHRAARFEIFCWAMC